MAEDTLTYARVLAERPVLLVFDDFERNLTTRGDAFLNPDVGEAFQQLSTQVRRGRLLITCRYPVPGAESTLRLVRIGPLSAAESRKLLRRLPALQGDDPQNLTRILRVVGGHPRTLELLDALLRGGQGRLPHVTRKLRELLAAHDVDVTTSVVDLDESLQMALALGARDVFLAELLAVARAERLDEALLQVAVSNLPVTSSGLARMLASDDARSAATR